MNAGILAVYDRGFGAFSMAFLVGSLMTFCIVWVMRSRQKNRNWGAVGLAAFVFVVGVCAVLMLIGHSIARNVTAARHDSTGRSVTVQVNRAPSERSVATPASEAWIPSADHEFEADIYPSIESAAAALGRRMAASLKVFVSEDRRLPSATVEGNLPPSAMAAASEAFHRAWNKLPQTVPPTGPGPAPRPNQPLKLDLQRVADDTGRLEATLSGGDSGHSVTRHARYVDKPWVEDFEAYRSGQSNNDRTFLAVVYSPGLSPTRQEAESQTEQLAVARIQSEIEGLPSYDRRGHEREPHVLPNLIRNALHGHWASPWQARSGGIVGDRFTQRFHRDYGDVWRSAMLIQIQASPNVLEGLRTEAARQITASRHARRTDVTRTVVSIAGLAVLIVVVYLALNAATKGYYTWVLRGAVVVIVVTGVVFLLNVI